jgi:preprotein translocase SecF subunit
MIGLVRGIVREKTPPQLLVDTGAVGYELLVPMSTFYTLPAIGQEVTRAAVIAVIAASLAILAFLMVAFRKVSHPIRYGVSALAAMLHDILGTVGVFSIMSLLFGWEADALFLTAILTVIGFSVQDKIVVFDRIRENSPKYRGEPFAAIANRSLLETLHRSLATQLNALFIMAALLLFGGATIKQFIAVMFYGLVSGTYSSIFNAVPLLVAWEERDFLGIKRRRDAARTA